MKFIAFCWNSDLSAIRTYFYQIQMYCVPGGNLSIDTFTDKMVNKEMMCPNIITEIVIYWQFDE